MRRMVRVSAEVGPEERLGRAIAQLPRGAQRALVEIADREDLPLVAGSWDDGATEDGGAGSGGCLVTNVCRVLDARDARPALRSAAQTVDLRVLELLPELSSRDLNVLIVAWDEAAAQEGRDSDGALRWLLRGGLAQAGLTPGPAQALIPTLEPGYATAEPPTGLVPTS